MMDRRVGVAWYHEKQPYITSIVLTKSSSAE